MSEHDNASSRASDQPRGATTAGKGTPFPVDVSTSRRARRTGLVFLAGPIIWTAHFLAVYLVVEAGCTGDGAGLTAFDPPVPEVVTVVVTAVAAVACLGAAYWAYRRWRVDRSEHPAGAGIEPLDRGGTLAHAGILLSLLGFVAVLFVGVPALVLPACLP